MRTLIRRPRENHSTRKSLREESFASRVRDLHFSPLFFLFFFHRSSPRDSGQLHDTRRKSKARPLILCCVMGCNPRRARANTRAEENKLLVLLSRIAGPIQFSGRVSLYLKERNPRRQKVSRSFGAAPTQLMALWLRRCSLHPVPVAL